MMSAARMLGRGSGMESKGRESIRSNREEVGS
jgi:hypothetical protein